MKRLIVLFTLALSVGCSNDDPAESKADAGPSCTFPLTWGQLNAQGDFTPFKNGDSAEITLGFQGFRYIQSVLKLDEVKAQSATHSARIVVEGQTPYSLSDTPVKVADQGGTLYSEEVLVFFNDLPIAEIVGKSAEITLTAKAGGCVGSTKTTVTLRDDLDCVQQEDGGLVCDKPDGGT
ncbi:MAG: hypothetical protein HYZ29_05765 [Myxococcales bacterium]|nr:hypothetical protein [Myxococcales bacterium]